MTESNNRMSPGEAQLTKELLAKKWALDQASLELKALYASLGEDASERRMYVDAQRIAASGKPEEVLSVDPRKLLDRARAFLLASQALEETLEVAKAEVSLHRGPEELNRVIERYRRRAEQDESGS